MTLMGGNLAISIKITNSNNYKMQIANVFNRAIRIRDIYPIDAFIDV